MEDTSQIGDVPPNDDIEESNNMVQGTQSCESNTSPIPAPYIRIKYHPASGKEDTFRPLENFISTTNRPSKDSESRPPSNDAASLYHPFRTLQDFGFAEYTITRRLSNEDIDVLLDNMRQSWCDGLKVTFKSHWDIAQTILHADEYDYSKVCHYSLHHILDNIFTYS